MQEAAGHSICSHALLNSKYTEWFKKMDRISYGYIFWAVYRMWMIYITFESGGPIVWNTTARALAVQKRQLWEKMATMQTWRVISDP
jgi:hypothetical protein